MIEQYILFPIVALFGLVFGSFANVLIYRLCDEKAPKFWQGRSRCPKCKKEIGAKDNIPLVSYFLLKGKCRHCKRVISWHYPLVEFLTALAFVLCFTMSPLAFGLLGQVVFSILAFCFIVIFFADLFYGLIPDEMVVVASLVSIVFHFSLHQPLFVTYLLTGAASGLAFFLIVLATKFKGMGLGDVKFALMMGLVLGYPNILVACWMAFVLGGVVACSLLLLKKTRLSATIPLGPFLVVGTLIAALWSNALLHFVGL